MSAVGLEHKPLHAFALDDARSHLTRAVAALRAAATLDPDTARRVSGLHASLCDAVTELNSFLPGRSGHPAVAGLSHCIRAERPSDFSSNNEVRK